MTPNRFPTLPALLAAAVLAAACGGRTTAASQPAPAGWDPAKNDPKAVAVADAMVTALGGADKWTAVQQLRWDVKVEQTGKVVGMFSHAWDRWNARHRFESVSLKSYEEAMAANDPDLMKWSTIMYRLFERDSSGVGYWDGNEVPSGDRRKMIDTAYEHWLMDSYLLTFGFRVNDPGTHLEYVGESSDQHCPDTCDIIKLTFDPSIGKDVYILNVNRKTHLPDLLEIHLAGKGNIAYGVSDWETAGGLRFPGKLDNLGVRDSGSGTEVWLFSDIQVGDADDALYIPQVR